jgi:ATP-dependent helicase HrpB
MRESTDVGSIYCLPTLTPTRLGHLPTFERVKALKPQLPIDSALPDILSALEQANCLIVVAPPGTGKTTRVAPAIMETTRGRVVLIQPRRIAARAAAYRIASELGATVGQLVGYQVRFDSRVSSSTQLVAVTPGILLRQLQSDPLLTQVDAVLLDEFHERSLEGDLLLGILRQIQQELRPELRLLLMSATLDGHALQASLENPPIVRVKAHTYPVTIHHTAFGNSTTIPNRKSSFGVHGGHRPSTTQRIVEQAILSTRQAAQQAGGDILVFLPGVGEIMQVERGLRIDAEKNDWRVMPLYGDMSADDQDRVLAACDARRIILATNVAETSLTIEGVDAVVDSGWARVQRFDAALGLNRLQLEPICKASADQRAGRAGRTAPGNCFRLWDEATGRSRPDYLDPEILRVDLSGAVLQLLCWGESDIEAFPWLTRPNKMAIEHALSTLKYLGAVADERVTELGQTINRFPVQPRLARLLIEGQRLGIATQASLAAALLSEREVFQRPSGSRVTMTSGGSEHRNDLSIPDLPTNECDICARVWAVQQFEMRGQLDSSLGCLKASATHNVLRVAKQLQRLMQDLLPSSHVVTHAASTSSPEARNPRSQATWSQLPRALLAAFPDRLARRREPARPRGIMVGGRGVKLDSGVAVDKSEFFICLDVDGAHGEALVRRASAVDVEALPIDQISQRDERFFNPTQGSITTRRRTFFLDLMLSEMPVETPTDEETARLLSAAAAERFERLLPAKDKSLHQWLARFRWLAAEMPDAGFPTLQTDELADYLAHWCAGLRRLDELTALPWKNLLESMLDAEQRRLLQREAPDSYTLPSGRTISLQYEIGKPPILAARIQEFFGLTDTPRLARGRVCLLLHLLAPNGRVHQITDDLASFWSRTYPVVRKELRGRYPKHAWPENPSLGAARP